MKKINTSIWRLSSSADLKKVGTDVYANHIDTKVLMLAYAFDDGPVRSGNRT